VNPFAKRLASQELHGHVVSNRICSLDRPEVVHGDDVAVLKLGKHACLAREPDLEAVILVRRVRRELRLEDLERHEPVERHLSCPVDTAHPPVGQP
jgi:hypothetical protein